MIKLNIKIPLSLFLICSILFGCAKKPVNEAENITDTVKNEIDQKIAKIEKENGIELSTETKYYPEIFVENNIEPKIQAGIDENGIETLTFVFAGPFAPDDPIIINEYKVIYFEIVKKSLKKKMEEVKENDKYNFIKYNSNRNDFYLSFAPAPENAPITKKAEFWLIYPLNDNAVCVIFSSIENQNIITDELAQKIYQKFQCFSLTN